MYERHASKGTVFITMKRSNLKPRKVTFTCVPTFVPRAFLRNTLSQTKCDLQTKKAPPPPEDYRCLIRAGDGKKTISTTVPTTQHAKFANSINVIMKVRVPCNVPDHTACPVCKLKNFIS
eukprot:scaffold196582_cov25-Tisochrysis_lutea.AAC.2